MKSFCLTLRESTERTAWARQQLDGLDVEMFYGINNHKFGAKCVRQTGDGIGEYISTGYLGNFLSHLMLWHVIAYGDWPEVTIFEDDVILCPRFQKQFDERMAATPDDWDIIYAGHCCTDGHEKRQVAPGVYTLIRPQCLHCYVVKRETCRRMIEQQDHIHIHLDIQIAMYSLPHLNCYTWLPGLAEQNQTTLPKATT